MERGDILTIIAGIIIVIAIAIAAKYSGVLPAVRQGSSSVTEVPSLTTQVTTSATETTVAVVQPATTLPATTSPTQIPAPADPVPYRIFYTDKPFSYPVFKLPENMGAFGAGELPWKNPDVVTFAYIEEPRGGLSQVFNVPYGLWRMNISVESRTKPQYARFDVVLCYAKDGRIIDGMEIRFPGSAFRNIQVSNTDMYLIISTQNVDRFRISFETPRTYYNEVAENS
ncbi:MAG: hypothetical protein A4E35_00901 [Methanoregula sp. PtaU1.Bin051]|nr:MAG: hypothetical protein A4E35_00901 [Methanoregula sp. PtaU1.Bin051]